MKRMTTREKVLEVLRADHIRAGPLARRALYVTATDLARMIPGTKLSSLSSLLLKMVKDKQLERHGFIGPRGGFGYKLKGWN